MARLPQSSVWWTISSRSCLGGCYRSATKSGSLKYVKVSSTLAVTPIFEQRTHQSIALLHYTHSRLEGEITYCRRKRRLISRIQKPVFYHETLSVATSSSYMMFRQSSAFPIPESSAVRRPCTDGMFRNAGEGRILIRITGSWAAWFRRAWWSERRMKRNNISHLLE